MSNYSSSSDEEESGGIVICRPDPLKGASHSWLLQSDVHVGSPLTDYELVKEELEDAARKSSRIILNGDLFENLFHTNTKMYTPHAVHKRLRSAPDQVNKAIEWAVELYGPYAHLIDMVGEGNHESRSVKHGHIDMIAMFVKELNRLGRHKVNYGGYCGFIDYKFSQFPLRRFVIYYHHGWGSGSSLASAVSDFNRTNAIERADVVWLGHKHCRLNAEVVRPSCPKWGFKTKVRNVRLIRTGAYMDSYGAQSQDSLFKEGRRGNYAADAGLMGHGKGGAWLNLTLSPKYKLTVTQ